MKTIFKKLDNLWTSVTLWLLTIGVILAAIIFVALITIAIGSVYLLPLVNWLHLSAPIAIPIAMILGFISAIAYIIFIGNSGEIPRRKHS